ncbi:hypothetical protein G6F57_019593 [Rhizopus arrhizus]|nr:hypothetical protein G6F57_019593 [Rhizopus arrhizus]
MRQLTGIGPFHGLIAWHSFFHLRPEDQRLMFPIFRRLAAPGAVLMFTSGTALGEAIGTFEGKPLYHGSLDASEYRQLLAENGFSVVRHQQEDPAQGAAPTRYHDPALPAGVLPDPTVRNAPFLPASETGPHNDAVFPHACPRLPDRPFRPDAGACPARRAGFRRAHGRVGGAPSRECGRIAG